MLAFLALFCGGGLGATTRHYLSLYLVRFLSLQGFWAILMVNLIGCFMIGLISAPLTRLAASHWKLFLVTGFLGGFTTYSTFMLDFVLLNQKAQYHLGLLHLSTHLVGGTCFCLLGLHLSHLLLKV